MERAQQSTLGSLTEGTDGFLYGVTPIGGNIQDNGTIYRISKDGVHTVLHHFNGTNGRGANCELVQAADGHFYGTAEQGGDIGWGTIYRITQQGVLTRLHSFAGGVNGEKPHGRLAIGDDGNIYGSALAGTIFKVTPAGTVSLFSHPTVWFTGGLTKGSDGNLYGTNLNGRGGIFKVTPEGVYTALVGFNWLNGDGPRGGLTLGSDGNFYGVTSTGGGSGFGTIYRVTPAGALTSLYSFQSEGGRKPEGGLTPEVDGEFYGTTSSGGPADRGTVFKVTTAGVKTELAGFISATGAGPQAGLTAADDGFLYGTTAAGGNEDSGVIFRVGTDGAVSRLHSFVAAESQHPAAPLLFAGDGALYGTSQRSSPRPGVQGYGSIFKFTRSGTFSVVRPLFEADSGYRPAGKLLEAPDGALYGTMSEGGSFNGGPGMGTLFRITKAGTFSTLHTFGGYGGATGGLISGADGFFYGVAKDGPNGATGSVFRISPEGSFKTMGSMLSGTGKYPRSSLVLAPDGNFYGTADFGGLNDFGTVFTMSPSGTITRLHSFNGSSGKTPDGGLALAPDGNFYGVTRAGGWMDHGTIYRISPTGQFTLLHSFTGTDGKAPVGIPVFGADGKFYGVTERGGAGNSGTVFRFARPPTITSQPATQLRPDRATLHARVHPNGAATKVDFFVAGVRQGTVDVPAGEEMVAVEFTVDGLTPGTAYQSSANASSSAGTAITPIVPFRTDALPVANNKILHAPGIGIPTSIYSSEVDTSDSDGDPRTLSVIEYSGAGTVSTDGTEIIYRGAGFVGEETILVRADDGRGGLADAVITLTNLAPLASARLLHAPLAGEPTVVYSANDHTSDPDGDARVLSVISYLGAGTVEIAGAELRYTSAGFTGQEVITLRVSDEHGGFVEATVTLLNAAPTAADRTLHAPKIGTPLKVYSAADQASDADGDALTLRIVSYEGHGSATVDGVELLYTNEGFVGAETIVLEISDGRGGHTTSRVTLTNAQPTAADILVEWEGGAVDIPLLPHAADEDGDPLILSEVHGQRHGSLSPTQDGVRYTPSADFEGRDLFTYAVHDGRGGVATAVVQLHLTRVLHREIAVSGRAVPGAGVPGSGVPAGARWRDFGVPFALGEHVGCLASFDAPSGRLAGIFSGNVDALALLLKSGDPATDAEGRSIPGAIFKKFKDPVFADAHTFAVLATVTGPRSTIANRSGLWVHHDNTLRRIALEGEAAADISGAKFAALLSVAMTEEKALFLMAKLRSGTGGVRASNDAGLWLWTEGTGLRLIVREGDQLELRPGMSKTVRKVSALTSVAGSPGEGRYLDANSRLAVRLTFTDGAQAIGAFDVSGSFLLHRLSGESESGQWVPVKFGMPDLAGEEAAAIATFARPDAAVSNRRVTGLLARSSDDSPVALAGAPVPGVSDAFFARFLDPVSAGQPGKESTAFIGEIRVSGKSASGVWMRGPQASELELVARSGTEAPDANGASFARFTSLAMLPGTGPVFVAALARTSGVNGKNDSGLWAMTSAGELRLLLREGVPLGGDANARVLRSFRVLESVAGSPGQRRAFGDDRRIVYRATFDNSSTALLRVTVP